MSHEDFFLLKVLGFMISCIGIFIGTGYALEYYKYWRNNKATIKMWGKKIKFTTITIDELKKIRNNEVISFQKDEKGLYNQEHFCGIKVDNINKIEISYTNNVREIRCMHAKRKRIVYINEPYKVWGDIVRITFNGNEIKYAVLGYGASYSDIKIYNP